MSRRPGNRSFASVSDLLAEGRPTAPVYCVYPEVYRRTAERFVESFPGRVLYAVKANDEPEVIAALGEGGVRHFDCASLPEVERASESCPGSTCYFMVPVRLRGAALEARERFGVRHFMIDHDGGLSTLAGEMGLDGCVVFVRMAVHHPSASQDLSSKFGAPPERVGTLLERVRSAGAEPALAFNVGSAVRDPAAYREALDVAAEVLAEVPFRVRLVDIGGGYPHPYPGFDVPPLEAYFAAVIDWRDRLPLAGDGELLCEPGRALAAPGMSAVIEVLAAREDRLYLNDGMYGVFWELRFGMHDRYPVRVYREGKALTAGGLTRPFRLYGPTCDSTDVLPGRVELPGDMRVGDVLEFGRIGAYSISGRTRFNGHYSDDLVTITGAEEHPPA